MQVQVSSKDERHTTSQFSFDYNDENVVGSSDSSHERGTREITRVVTGSESSPIRRSVVYETILRALVLAISAVNYWYHSPPK